MYGFTIDVDGTAVKALKQIEDELKKLTTQTQNATQEMKSQFDGLAGSLGHVGTVLAEVFAVREIFNFGKELMHLTAEFEGFTNVIKYSSLGMTDASNNLQYVRDSIERLHLPMKETYESFSEMQAGFVGTGIEGEKLRKVFEGVAEASSVMHLAPATFSRVTFALKEIGELGTLQARQLRMLAFALPGSMAIAAKSLGKTTEEMHEAMKKGEIKSSDFLPKFANELTLHFSPGLTQAGHSLISQMNDEQTAITKTMLEMGESLRPLFVDILKDIITGVSEIKSIWASMSGDGSFVETLQGLLKWVLKLVPIWVTYKAVMFGVNAISKIFSITNGVLTASLGEVTIMLEGTTLATEGLGAAFASIGIGAIVIGIGLLVEKLIEVNRQSIEAADNISHLSKTSQLFKDNASLYTGIADRFAISKTLDKGEQGALLADAMQAQEKIKNSLNRELNPQLEATRKAYESGIKVVGHKTVGTQMGATYQAEVYGEENAKKRDELKRALEAQTNDQKYATAQIKNLGGVIKTLQAKGIAVPKGGGATGGSSVTDSAINVSNLSGGKGGLGEARNITIIFKDALQKITVQDGRNIKDYGEDAIEMIIRTLNNMAYSQSSTF